MKRTGVAINVAGLAVLLGIFVYALVGGNLKVAMILTQMDRAECFNEPKLSIYSQGIFQGIRSHEAAAHISGPWAQCFYLAMLLGACVCLANILFLRSETGSKRLE